MSAVGLHLGKGTETEIMNDEQKIALAIESLIDYFHANNHRKETAIAEAARSTFERELREAGAISREKPPTFGLEAPIQLQ